MSSGIIISAIIIILIIVVIILGPKLRVESFLGVSERVKLSKSDKSNTAYDDAFYKLDAIERQ